MTFAVSDAAREDLAKAIRFYDSKPGRYVAREFARAAKAIAANPRQYSPVDDDIPGLEVREFFIERFEQRVIYLVSENRVLVVAVVHVSRRWGSWHRQLESE